MFGLSFLSPWFLAGIAAAAGPLLLHLFARETAPVALLPTARFVPAAAVEQTRRRRLQDLWLLLLRVAAVVLLAFVFARPFWAQAAAATEPGLTIIAVDRSLSMAGDRAAEARRLAEAALGTVGRGTQVALVAFDHEARVIVAPTAGISDVGAALGTVEPGYGGTNYAAMLRVAIELARGQPARLIAVTDGQRAGVDGTLMPAVPTTLEIDLRTIAPPVSNLSVDLVEAAEGSLVALVRNHGPVDRTTRLRWLVDGREVTGSALELAAGATVETSLGNRVPERAAVTVSVDDPEGFVADNTRYFVTDPPTPMPILVVRGVDASAAESFYLGAALDAAASQAGGFAVTSLAADDARLTDVAALADARALAMVGTRGLDRRAREAIAKTVQAGAGLLLAVGPDAEPGVVRDLVGAGGHEMPDLTADATTGQALVAGDLRHPVLAALGDTAGNLGQVRVDRAWTLREWPGATTLVRLSGGRPAVVEFAAGRGRVLLITTDVGRRWNTWPLHPTFVPFVVESMRYLAGGSSRPRDLVVGSAEVAGADRPGVVEAGARGRVAVNVDPHESRVDALGADEFVARLERVSTVSDEDAWHGEVEAGQGLWRLMAWVLLGVLAIEGLVAARSRTVQPASAPAAVLPRNEG